jgi:hypothetical protein
MIVFKRFINVSPKEIYATGIFAVQPVAAQSADDPFAGSDIDIPMLDIPIPAPSGDASNPQINSNTVMNLLP